MAATTMAMAGSAATSSLRVAAENKAASSLSSSAAFGRVNFGGVAKLQRQRVAHRLPVKAAKELHFNKDGSAIKRMQVGAFVGSGLGFCACCVCIVARVSCSGFRSREFMSDAVTMHSAS